MPPAPRVSRSTAVRAPAEAVWDLVSDLPGMGRFSPEATGGRWVRGGGPVVGAVLRGTNASGRRRWSTRCRVVSAERGRAFAFDVVVAGLAVARWSYDLVPTADGCTVTETWEDRRGRLIAVVGRAVTGVADREAFTAASVERTLAAVRAEAERLPVASQPRAS